MARICSWYPLDIICTYEQIPVYLQISMSVQRMQAPVTRMLTVPTPSVASSVFAVLVSLGMELIMNEHNVSIILEA